ncbi:TonB-dependent receptor [Xylella taiwanensis]|uniref:Ligand-gated channel n=1 Tax=Xylella taiwanensis TaxID=1444770 RepID=Z9JN24_9GAMM|nr:TonB-dependent receptor [Xylella taiwanensis]AXI83323.1 ligand-gated channel [Xylella taiwanensis]EWS79147.1 ligand-gated channel [Xylella taiwanensis]MCD8456394.1 TonB-dependent receptor [Xylella taiwanensis]MCD8458802.1 TonB-dependent receptor [Xylella taiwanensis]MCD8460938.1 TonB-dependent receptor [Xylella taiwanensis]
MKNRSRFLAFTITAAFSCTVFPIQAQSISNKTLDTLIVTGTRISDRTAAESSSPIDIISPQTLEATGTTELATALARAVPSLNFPRPAISDGSDAVRPAQLRGLAPDQVLVLVNGKRYHTTAMVNLNEIQGRGSSPADLNTIPIAAVERIEVLRDGASAQYGSDAIAGVINVVLKGAGKGGSITGHYGQYKANDGKQYEVSGDTGLSFAGTGKIHLAAQDGHQDQTNRALPYNGIIKQRYGDPRIDQGAFSYNGQYSPTDGVTFYSFGMASRREVLSNGYYRWADDPRNRPEIYPEGFLPQIYNVTKDVSWVSGLKASTAWGLNIDLSYNYGNNQLTFDVKHSLNNSLGLTSPTEFYAGALQITQHVLNADFSKSLDWGKMAYPLNLAFGAEWRGENFSESAGDQVSYINGGVRSNAGTLLPGAQVFSGFKPSDAGHYDRNSHSLYIDLEQDLTEKLSAGLAGRYEHYSDFGNTTTGKLSLRYAFTPKVAVRATTSNGFRAPSLQQQFFQSISTEFIGGVPYEIGTFRTDNSAAIALGAEPLKAEKSKNYSMGLVLQPADDLHLTIDAYRINIDDRIVLSENLTSTAVRTYLQANGYAGIGGGRYFTNAVDTKTTGADAVGSYHWTLSNSTIDITLGYNYNKTEVTHVADNPTGLTAIDSSAIRISQAELTRITQGTPRDKAFLSGIWSIGNWLFTATGTRWGEFTVYNTPTTAPVQQTFAPKWTLDLAASYRLQHWNFTIGADNVTNTYPDRDLVAQGTRSYLPYNRSSPFGFNGAFAYANISYKW